ncbi:glycosyltransferase family 2 protein [Fluoribacter dumoffii]|uniref:Undecaprenyl-phosphate 4-deoxy-4-formamido-L-arabinose transferase n=1 Tax=Fluoribacter dumoffii TaxID=463 RepID=A0A377G7C2_9GAMM|nr:glycosyltransferase family 2 protein [Fluoribacter dumoffii]KTC89616.1 glycosyltransferase [Fluoribacter dumoffii NY 23]MCW8384809.1 glycosyltransferase family 2 protein [Fluoribacter dumoffii]MCW8417872.1 glycosyltransferase family 2 protein [Fluoribacter dumoffii]MCW8454286.1 glycosyltransferase family 2 protein [Fluoribacter dumoffii]MCW8461640.1 glycosyltransferase family 2 protein [Fluoribacter dumoffii]
MIFDANNSSDFNEKSSSEIEKVVIIIPTHNEASVIQSTIEQVFTSVESVKGYDVHILIFDSASTDNTQQIVTSLQSNHPKLHLRNESIKSGLGSAYLQAMNYALTSLNADIIFEFDADLSHQPKYIPPILEMLQTCDCVLGSRYISGGSIPKDWELHRKLFSILGNYIARAVLTPRYKDFTSGFRATRRQQLLKILPHRFLTNHYAYKMQLLWLLHKNKARIREFPIDFIDRNEGYSKLPKNSIVDSLRVVFTLRYHAIKRYLKMCLVGSLGIAVQFIVYNVLRGYVQISPFDASQIAVCAAIINNFILNSKITFGDKNKIPRLSKIKRLVIFTIYSLFIINLQSYWLKFGVLCFGGGPLRENVIMSIGIGLISLLNYYTYSRHIWSEKLLPSN